MGTRADFYVGKGLAGEWLGSIAWDGYREGIHDDILKAVTEESYRTAVTMFLKSRDDSTFPEQGWPWPWETSATTDCSYWFFDDQCWEAYGYPTEHYIRCQEELPIDEETEEPDEAWLKKHERVEFPDMTDKQKVTLGSRSGLLVFGG